MLEFQGLSMLCGFLWSELPRSSCEGIISKLCLPSEAICNFTRSFLKLKYQLLPSGWCNIDCFFARCGCQEIQGIESGWSPDLSNHTKSISGISADPCCIHNAIAYWRGQSVWLEGVVHTVCDKPSRHCSRQKTVDLNHTKSIRRPKNIFRYLLCRRECTEASSPNFPSKQT
jgi:hypothetical protein